MPKAKGRPRKPLFRLEYGETIDSIVRIIKSSHDISGKDKNAVDYLEKLAAWAKRDDVRQYRAGISAKIQTYK